MPPLLLLLLLLLHRIEGIERERGKGGKDEERIEVLCKRHGCLTRYR